MLGEGKVTRNQIVVRFKDGRLLKGYTLDFTAVKDMFHLVSEQDQDRGKVYEIWMNDLKAVFFVKQLDGDKDYSERKKFQEVENKKMQGLKIKIVFEDGEIIRGVSFVYNKNKKGFFVIPVDPKSNNDRIYIIRDATKNVEIGAAAID